MAAEQVKISVRSLVEFILRSGDIDNMSGSEPVSVDAMLEGGRIHRKLQKEGGPDYEAEAALSHTSRIDDQIQIISLDSVDKLVLAADGTGKELMNVQICRLLDPPSGHLRCVQIMFCKYGLVSHTEVLYQVFSVAVSNKTNIHLSASL